MFLTAYPQLTVLTLECDISDVHKMVCFSTKAHALVVQNSFITYRTYKHFNETSYLNDLFHAPFHVGNIFDDANDSMWFCETLIRDVHL